VAYASNEGIRIHYEVEGRGPALVLQHGITRTLDIWRQRGYVDALKSNYRLILVDARGHGTSDKPHDAHAYELSQRSSDVVAVLDALAIERAHYWGYSMGGLIGFGMAKHAPQRLHGLIIGGQTPYERHVGAVLPNGEEPRPFLVALLRSLGADFDVLPAEEQRLALANDTRAIAASIKTPRPSLETMLPLIEAPCLLYAGENDSVFVEARKAAAAIPGCRFVAMPVCNHGQAFHRDGAMILPHVLEFLRHADERFALSRTSSGQGV